MATMTQIPITVTQKAERNKIKKNKTNMTMEDIKKDVIPISWNKKESLNGLYISFQWGYRGGKYKNFLKIF